MNRFAAACMAVSALVAGVAAAQDPYPSRPIQLIVPLAPGTTIDMVSRTYADKLSQRLGQPVLVQNRPGAGGTIAAASVAKSAPDGYTILLVNSQHSINPLLYDNLPYETLRDFAGIGLVGVAPSLVVVHPKLGVRTLKDFIALAKQRPGQIHYGSAGLGTTTHLGAAYLASRAGVELVHVPYKGGEIVADILSGRIEAIVVPVAFLLSHIRDGKLLALAVTTREPLRTPLEVPPVEQAGLSGFEYVTYYGFVAPGKTPRPVLERLNRDIRSINDDKDLREKFTGQAIFQRDLPLGEFDAYVRAEMERIAPVVKAIGARAK